MHISSYFLGQSPLVILIVEHICNYYHFVFNCLSSEFLFALSNSRKNIYKYNLLTNKYGKKKKEKK